MAIELEPEELEKELDDLQRKLERLRVLYEQFFMGMERTPPYNLRREVVRIVHRLAQVRTRHAGLKFRLSSLIQRFNSHKAYWARTTREIESGTYKKHQYRVKRRESQATEAEAGLTTQDFVAINQIRDQHGEEAAEQALADRKAARTEAGDLADQFMRELQGERASDASSDAAPASRGAEPEDTPVPRQPPRTETDVVSPNELRGVSADDLKALAARLKELRARFAGGGGGGESAAPDPDRKARQVYDRLVAAKKGLNEPTDKLSFDAVKVSLAKQAERTREKHGCKSVDFDVVVKDGKAFLKAIPK